MNTTMPAAAAALKSIPINQLEPNPWNRTVFDPQGLEELAASLKAEGVREPLKVRPLKTGKYQITSGHRRWLAAAKAGLAELPCLVEDESDQDVAEDNITTNIQREDIWPLELARMVKAYMEQFDKTQRHAATTFGKSEAWASELLSFLLLDPEALKNFKALKLGWDSLRSIKQLPPPLQQQVANELKDRSLKPENLIKRCNQLRLGNPSGKQHPKDQPAIESDPLAAVWERVQMEALAVGKPWSVQYGLQAAPWLGGVKLPAWQFLVPNLGPMARADLKQWFERMAKALGDGAPAELPELPEVNGRRRLPEAGEKLRIPRTAADEAELKALSAQGPGPVLSWLYGPESFIAKQARDQSWAQAGYKDPGQGLKDFIEGAKAVEKIDGGDPSEAEQIRLAKEFTAKHGRLS